MKKYYSQAGQDRFIFERLGGGNHLFFLDVGAHNGVSFSNTLALEQEGWRGLCIEPNPRHFVDLRKNRKASNVPVAVSNFDGSVRFSDGNFDGRISETGELELQCQTFRQIFAEHDVPACIDYLSLDIEEHEAEALSEFPFETHMFRYATIEHNVHLGSSAMKDQIFWILSNAGYERIFENVLSEGDPEYPFEDWYAHSSMNKGKP